MMPPGTMTGSWTVLMLGALSRSVALQQQESVATKGQVVVPGLDCYLGT